MTKILSLSNDVKLSRNNIDGAVLNVRTGTGTGATTIAFGMNRIIVFIWHTSDASGVIMLNMVWNYQEISNMTTGTGKAMTTSGNVNGVTFTPQNYSGDWTYTILEIGDFT